MNAEISLYVINFLTPTPTSHFSKKQICPAFVQCYRVFSASGAEKICTLNFQAIRPCLTCQLHTLERSHSTPLEKCCSSCSLYHNRETEGNSKL